MDAIATRETIYNPETHSATDSYPTQCVKMQKSRPIPNDRTSLALRISDLSRYPI